MVVYDQDAVQAFINNNKAIVEAHGWPTTADDFVELLGRRHGGGDLYNFIHKIFTTMPENIEPKKSFNK